MAKAATTRLRAPQMQPEERKRQLLEVGVACFAGKGIGGTKHADLARASKVSVPTIFTYFPNRDSLITSILNEVGKRWLENIITPAQALPDPDERVSATAIYLVNYAKQQPDFVKVWLMWSMHFAPKIQRQFRKFESKQVEALAEMIKEGSSTNDPDQDIHDRARVISNSSSILAKMVFDGASEARRALFIEHVLRPITRL